MKESVLTFGKRKGLVGILSVPSSPDPSRPAILLLNAGIQHRPGPFRMYVEIARALAASGFNVLRFDLSGLGDSEVQLEQPDERARGIEDVRAAMEILTKRTGAASFVLGGLCSGADLAHHAGLACPEVAGAFFLDGYGYQTQGYHLRKRLMQLARISQAGSVTGHQVLRKLGLTIPLPAASENAQDDLEQYLREFPSRERFKQDVLSFVERGTRLLYVYTSGSCHYFNHRRQFRAMLDFADLKGLVDLELLSLADHTCSLTFDRRMLVERLISWSEAAFPKRRKPETFCSATEPRLRCLLQAAFTNVLSAASLL